MCLVHNHLGRDHYARCAMKPKSSELWAEVSKECCLISQCADITSILADSSFNLRWTVTIHASVAAYVLPIDGINIASTTGNNVGTTSSFKEILAPGKLRAAIFSGPDRS